MILLVGIHKLHEIIFTDSSVDNLEVGNDAAKGIKHRVEDECLQGCIFVALRSRNTLHNSLKDIVHTNSRLSARTDNIFAVAAEKVDYLVLNLIGLRTVEVHLVNYRNNLQIVVDCHIEIRDSLCLNAL